MYKCKRTQIHRPLCCSGTNILLWTSDFGSSTRGERQFLKVFRNYTMLTTPSTFSASRGVLDLNSSSKKLNRCCNGRNSTLWQRTQFSACMLQSQILNCLPQWQRTQLSAHMVQSQLPTDSFSKSSISQDHRFQAWHHAHSSPFPIWGLLWQLWLTYPLCTSVNCT